MALLLLLLLSLVSANGSPRDAWLDILHRLYDQVEHHVGFCFGRDPLDIASAMEESFEFPTQSMSDHVCFNSTVLVKSLCGPEEIEIYYKFMLLTQNPEKIPSTSACPAAEVNKAECLPGFFGYDDGTKYHPCCDGYFCPRGLNCMIPCPKGSLCLRATPRPPPKRFPQESSSYWCAPFAYKRRMDLPCGGADTWSIIPQDAFPGVESWKYGSGNMYCPKRYFCPNTTTKLACPRGHYCKQGSTAPQLCPIGSFCPEKTEVPLSNYGGVSADVLLLLLLAIIWFVSKQYSQIMSNITHQDRLRIQWKPFPPRLHVAPKKHHRIESDTAVPISSDGILDSRVEDDTSSYGDGDADIDVAFFHLGMELVSHTRKVLLSDVSGRFEKRSVTAILGPSGAGKSSLLSLLGGRASSYAVQTSGHILVNGKTDNLQALRGNLGYVPQDDIMFSTLTVKENLLYAARFGLKRSSTWEDHQRAVFETISLLHLQSVQNELVGDPSSRYGISGGQKKRVNIGLEMVQKPKVLFLDEPTSGLDSSSAFSLIQSLREIATEKRVTTCAVLHQPRNECFYLCDNVLLMASGGTSVYYGKTHSVEKHFESLGFQLPIHTNPADFIVDIISTKDIDFGVCIGELLVDYRHEYPESAIILPSWSHDDHEQQVTAGDECPMYYSDDNENISVLRDTSIISKVLKAFAISFASLELKTPLLGKRTEHGDLNRHIGFFRQAYWFIERAALHRTREPLEAMADYIMVVLTGLTVGLLSDRGKSTIMSYASQVSYAVVALGLIATVSTTTTFTTHALMIKREYQSSGISKLAYFLALDAFDMIGSCIKSILFLAGWASFASPRATWTYLYMVTVFVFYSCAGISYALSLYLGESSSQLAAAIITLISTLVARQPDPGILMLLLQSISFPRFAMEGFLIAESNQLKGVWLLARCADLKLLNYDVRNFYIDLVALFLLGVGLRIVALEKLLRM